MSPVQPEYVGPDRRKAGPLGDRMDRVEEEQERVKSDLIEGRRKFNELAGKIDENTNISSQALAVASAAAKTSEETKNAVVALDKNLAGAQKAFRYFEGGIELWKIAGDFGWTLTKIVGGGTALWAFFKYVVQAAGA